MRSRRKGKIFITKNVLIPKNKFDVTSSTSSHHSRSSGSGSGSGSTFSEEGDSAVSEEIGRHSHDSSNHNNSNEEKGIDNSDEQLNIGFGPDPCWTNQKSTRDSQEMDCERNDILHTGSRKGGKLVVVLVGLPGSGKTYIARKVSRYLRWISYRTRVFSLAKYRLEKVGSKKASFFDPDNQIHYQMRVKLMMHAVAEAMKYLNRDGEIAIIDGTNYCRSRRDLIRERVSQEEGFEILWIESVISSGQYVSMWHVIMWHVCQHVCV